MGGLPCRRQACRPRSPALHGPDLCRSCKSEEGLCKIGYLFQGTGGELPEKPVRGTGEDHGDDLTAECRAEPDRGEVERDKCRAEPDRGEVERDNRGLEKSRYGDRTKEKEGGTLGG